MLEAKAISRVLDCNSGDSLLLGLLHRLHEHEPLQSRLRVGVEQLLELLLLLQGLR